MALKASSPNSGGLGSGKGTNGERRPSSGGKDGLSLKGASSVKRSPAASPATSDRNATKSVYTQKPKPSALAGRLRHDPDGPSPQPSPSGGSTASSEGGGGKAAKRGPMRAKAGAAEADAPAESPIGLTVDTGTTDSAGSAGRGDSDEFVPEPDEEPFVPEEEEEGPSTQGDHLMMAKSKMRRQRGLNSPGLDSPTNPFAGM